MKELKVVQLHKTYGEKTIFDQISFLIHEKDRIGLIGINGTGKSSLLKILAGIDRGDGDQQTVFYPSDYQIGYLAQEPDLDETQTILEAVFQADTPQLNAVRIYEQALTRLSENGVDEVAQQQYAKAEQRMNELDAWTIDAQAKSILQQVGLSDLTQTIASLSGGQKKRVGLAQVLITAPDLLLLDEPTNHLDYEAISWLEGYLAQYKGALLVVTHDRYFLDRVVNRMFELSNGELTEYKGNYENYLVERAERDRIDQEQESKRAQLYKQELAWMRAGAKARTTKQQARIKRFDELKGSLKQGTQEEAIELDFDTTRLGKKVIELKEVSYQIEHQPILDRFSLLVQARERLGITGENGAGKSTLLNLISGYLTPQQGTISIGETVRLAYYTQQTEAIDPEKRMITYLQEVAEEVQRSDGTTISVTELLERFLFPRHTHGSKIAKLSGGERRRLYLLKLLIEQPNVLLLDEPTNDLDIATLTILEDYLQTFPGAVLTVSHDRYFLDKVAEKLVIFNGQANIDTYFGTIEEYLAQKKTDTNEPVKEVKAVATPVTKEKTKLSYLEQKEWEVIEDEIATIEDKLVTLNEEMLHQGSDFTALQMLQKQIDEQNEQLEERYARWEYLSQFV
ncbi:ABC-F family ATP-binding cassette domain-containing protein [uncultured Enterococcus sp.]|uniref:ABC-F family ATP-binding cassette domain-containing protein n=1 Tax=uncultured Enterococcus sp. TaxID=167972 RepID=UPI0025DA96F8|nr:ABC-F family ATP-binding cassette domain-containing protein [uncultured Enterococcus sp.]